MTEAEIVEATLAGWLKCDHCDELVQPWDGFMRDDGSGYCKIAIIHPKCLLVTANREHWRTYVVDIRAAQGLPPLESLA